VESPPSRLSSSTATSSFRVLSSQRSWPSVYLRLPQSMQNGKLSGMRAVVAGGSIGGLCAGLALRHSGADVEIFERHPGPMETRGAGIVVQHELTEILRRYDAPSLPTTSCSRRRYLDPQRGQRPDSGYAAAVYLLGINLSHAASGFSE
jgi:hypothetical protein